MPWYEVKIVAAVQVVAASKEDAIAFAQDSLDNNCFDSSDFEFIATLQSSREPIGIAAKREQGK